MVIASVVLTAKLLYPMDAVEWKKWQEVFEDPAGSKPIRRDFDLLTSKDVSSLSGKEMDEYLKWYGEARLAHTEGR